MGKKVRSARGELVDFDYLKIKEQLATAPPPIEVKERQDFIESRLKRRLKKKPVAAPVETKVVDVAPTMPEPEPEIEKEAAAIVDVTETTDTETPVTKQKARRKRIT